SQVFTIPNLVSFTRLAAIPYFWWVTLLAGDIPRAALLIFVIGSTDWIDGYLARRLDQVTELGKFLDPLADRLMIASALVAGLIAGVVPTVIGVPLLVREVLVAAGAVYLAARGGGKLDVRDLGKTATFLLYGAIPAFYLTAADVAPGVFGPPAWLGGSIGLILYYVVAGHYARDIGAILATGRTAT
ncbi:MAG: CDP-alcohol phosphatidyltransferase family protein, partial [Acidimicrobiia bacterium]